MNIQSFYRTHIKAPAQTYSGPQWGLALLLCHLLSVCLILIAVVGREHYGPAAGNYLDSAALLSVIMTGVVSIVAYIRLTNWIRNQFDRLPEKYQLVIFSCLCGMLFLFAGYMVYTKGWRSLLPFQ